MRALLVGWCLCIGLLAFGQAQPPFSYQAYIRNGAEKPLVKRSVSLLFAIQQHYYDTIVYQETHQGVTGADGSITVWVGSGTAHIGNYKNIDWRKSEYTMSVAVDTAGGSNYVRIASMTLPAKPYWAGHYQYWDSIQIRHIYPVQRQYPYGCDMLYKRQFPAHNKGLDITPTISQEEHYRCWSYYMNETEQPPAKQYLPRIKTLEILQPDGYKLQVVLSEKVEYFTFNYRLPDMGVYEVYYITDMPIDVALACDKNLRNENAKGCCTGAAFTCYSTGTLLLYNRKTQAAKALNIYSFNGGYDGSQWMYFYIPDGSTIHLYTGEDHTSHNWLYHQHQIKVLKNGLFEYEIVKY